MQSSDETVYQAVRRGLWNTNRFAELTTRARGNGCKNGRRMHGAETTGMNQFLREAPVVPFVDSRRQPGFTTVGWRYIEVDMIALQLIPLTVRASSWWIATGPHEAHRAGVLVSY